jgi:hypothetical protein
MNPTQQKKSMLPINHRYQRHYTLNAISSPDDVQALLSFHELMSTFSQTLNDHDSFIYSASNFIADATVTDPSEQSWWDAYLNGIKSAISFVHSVIDQPLRNAGFDQTWGIAIFLFTAGLCTVCDTFFLSCTHEIVSYPSA